MRPLHLSPTCPEQGAANAVVDYFGSFGYQCPQYCNPADFTMRILRMRTADGEASLQNKDHGLADELADAHARQFQIPPDCTGEWQVEEDSPPSFATSAFYQCCVLIWRCLTNIRRDPYLMSARVVQTLCLGLLSGSNLVLAYFHVGCGKEWVGKVSSEGMSRIPAEQAPPPPPPLDPTQHQLCTTEPLPPQMSNKCVTMQA